MKKLEIDWNYWIVRFLFLMAVIIGFKLLSNIESVAESLRNLLSILSPFIVGFIAAYLLNGPQKRIQRLLEKVSLPFVQKKSLGLSVLLLYSIVLFSIFLILNYLVPLIITNVMDLINLLPAFYTYLNDLAISLNDNGIIELIKLEDIIANITASYTPEKLIMQGTSSLASLGLFAKNISSSVLNTFLAFIISLYALLFKESINKFFSHALQKLTSESTFNQTKLFLQRSNDIFYRFIGGQFLDACIIGVVSTILLSVLGVKFAVTLGILLGVCNMIPYFGSIFASVATMIITFFTGGLSLALTTIITLLILQQIDGNVIGPRIMKGALNLNPIIIIVSITVGGAYFGVLGMFLSVPVAAILKIIVVEWVESPEKQAK